MEYTITLCDWPGCEQEADYYTYGLGDACAHHFCPYMARPALSALNAQIRDIYDSHIESMLLQGIAFKKLEHKVLGKGDTLQYPIGSIKFTLE